MANKDTTALISDIIATIYENSNGDITGNILQSKLINIIQSRGLCEVFVATKIYYQNEVIVFTDNQIYKCLSDTTAGETPLTHPAKWTLLSAGLTKLDADLVNNTPGNIVVGDKTLYKAIMINFAIKRGALYEVGTINLTNKADVLVSHKSEFDDCGYTFTKSFSGDDIELNWTDGLVDGNDGKLDMSIIYINLSA